jgi:predicted Co/Zn/Cd cation transporter (cation efflux family)
MTPQVRQWLYTAAAFATALIPLLVAYKVIDTDVAGAWVNVIGVLGALGTGGATTAAVVTAKQRREGTLNFTGNAANQAVEAIKATVTQAGSAQSDLQQVIRVVSEVIPAALSVTTAPPAPNVSTLAATSDPASANYQP